MGQYRKYWCRKDRGGCGQRFSASKSEPSKWKVTCPACGSYGGKLKKDGTRVLDLEPMVPRETNFVCMICTKMWWQKVVEGQESDTYCPRCKAKGYETTVFDGETVPKVRPIGVRAPGFMRDVDSYDGRVHDPVPMPAFGPNASITSRSQLKDLQKRARDITMERTTGDKRHKVVDPETGKTEMVTVKGKEIDMGEVHTLEKRPEPVDMGAIARAEARAQIAKERGSA